MAAKIRVGLLFGNRLIREGRRMLLQSQPEIDIVYEGSDGDDALEALADQFIDVVLVDNRIHGLSGSALIQKFQRRYLGTDTRIPAFVLTGPFGSPQMALAAIRSGATDMVSEEESADEILKSIRFAANPVDDVDFAELSRFFVETGVPHGSNTRWLLRLTSLSDAEDRVLESLRSGFGFGEADMAEIGVGLDGLQTRLGLATRAQLALALFEAGVLPQSVGVN